MKSNFSIYLPQEDAPSDWGIDILGTGFAEIRPGAEYPPGEHPEGHLFDWDRGRTLSEYQVLFIAQGKGFLETTLADAQAIESPAVFLIFPNEWHRYRPEISSGWSEYWIAFDGPYPRSLQATRIISPRQPVYQVGHSDTLLSQFQLIQSETKLESFGFRKICASTIIQILALATTLPERRLEERNPMRSVIRKACFALRERIDENLSPEEIASELGIGYTYFRRLFKQFTGLSPKRYHSQLRLQKAKSLLRNTKLSIAEIANSLSFDSPYHFSNWFKKRIGTAPSFWRDSNS